MTQLKEIQASCAHNETYIDECEYARGPEGEREVHDICAKCG